MMERADARTSDILRGWKTYCAWGDVPNASGWFLDTDTGMAFLEQVAQGQPDSTRRSRRSSPPTRASRCRASTSAPRRRATSARRPRRTPACASSSTTRATTPATPSARTAATPSADSEHQHGRRADQEPAREQLGRVAVRQEGQEVRQRRPTSTPSSARSGASVMNDPDQAAHLLGKLITHVGPKRIALGHRQPLVRLAAGRRSSRCAASSSPSEGKELYGLPYGLEGDVEDPTQPAPQPDAHDPQRHPRPQRRARPTASTRTRSATRSTATTVQRAARATAT